MFLLCGSICHIKLSLSVTTVNLIKPSLTQLLLCLFPSKYYCVCVNSLSSWEANKPLPSLKTAIPHSRPTSLFIDWKTTADVRYFSCCGYFHTPKVRTLQVTEYQANSIPTERSQPLMHAPHSNLTHSLRGVMCLWLRQWFVALACVVWPLKRIIQHVQPLSLQKYRVQWLCFRSTQLSDIGPLMNTCLQPGYKTTVCMYLCSQKDHNHICVLHVTPFCHAICAMIET